MQILFKRSYEFGESVGLGILDHDYAKFIKPSELAGWIRDAGLESADITGLTYNPLTRVYRLDPGDVDVNYMVWTRRPV